MDTQDGPPGILPPTVRSSTALSVAHPVPWGGLIARIRASVVGRRLVPTELALLATDVLTRAALRRDPDRLATTVASMDAIVGGTLADTDLTQLAVRHVAAQARGWELAWRPWQLHRMPVEGLEHVHAARASGRGVIVSFVHLGPGTGWVALGRLLAPVVLLTNDPMDDDPPPGYWGYQLEHRRKLFRDAGVERLYAAGAAMPLYKLLSRGGTAMMSLDRPGDRRTTFLGRPVDMADGTAQLAVRTGALVVPAMQLPLGRRWRFELHAPWDPRDFADADALHDALAALHETAVRSHPEHLTNPRRPWANATRHGWFRE